MRICLVSEYYYPILGGVTEHVYQFAKYALGLGHEVTLLTSDAGPIDPSLIPPKLDLVRMGKSFLLRSNQSFARVTLAPRLGRSVRSFFESRFFDIVHIHSALTPTLPLLAARYSRTPVVGTIHTHFDDSLYYSLFKKQCQDILDAHDGLIAVSEICIEAMRKYFEFEATIIPNGVDLRLFQAGTSDPKYRRADFNILFLGRLDPRNGVDTLLEAFSIFRHRNQNTHLVIAGDGPLRSHYESLVNSTDRPSISFLGAVNGERPNLFASADVLCYPATKASFGITLLEAMAAGVPPIASDIQGFRALVRTGEEGILVPESNPGALSDAFRALSEDSELRQAMAQKGRGRAEEFSWNRVGKEILAYYTRILDSDHKRRASA